MAENPQKFSRHEKTEAARDRLRKLVKGEIVSYRELAVIIGCDPQDEGYRYVFNARRSLTRDNGYVFETHEGVGIKRLTDAEIAESKARKKRIRTQGRLQLLEKGSADQSKLNHLQQNVLMGDLATAGTIMHLTSFQFTEIQRTTSKLNPIPKPPPLIDG